MNEKPRKVGEIAEALGVVPNTIRNYCKRYASYLSASANPPANGVRLFTTRDLNALTFIHAAVKEGASHDEITVQLAAKSFSDGDVDVIVGMAEVLPPEASPEPQEGPETHEARYEAQMPTTRLDARIDKVEAIALITREELAGLRGEMKERVNYGWTMFLLGACLTLVIVAVALWLN